MNDQIFISYRRDGGDVTAKLICEALKNKGYTVFYDYDSLKGGVFDSRILSAIDQCEDFVLVLPKRALARCRSEKDWVRQEIRYALKQHKNIIPVMMEKFEFPKKLPSDIQDVTRYNGVRFHMDCFDAVIDQIIEKLSCASKGKSAETIFLSNSNTLLQDTGKIVSDNNRAPESLKATYKSFITSVTNFEFTQVKKYFEDGNDISVSGELFLMCEQVMRKYPDDKGAQKEFSELLLVFKTIYKLAIDKNQLAICKLMQSITVGEYTTACENIKEYMVAEVDNLDCVLVNTIFRYLSAYQDDENLKSYWESLLKEVFRLMMLCEEYDKKANNALVSEPSALLSETSRDSSASKKGSNTGLDEETLISGVLFGYKLGRLEFLWDSKFDFARAEFDTSLDDLKLFLDADHVPYDLSSFPKFSNSIINYYRVSNSTKLYAILIGIFTQRMELSRSVSTPSKKETLHGLAMSALATVPGSFLKGKDAFVALVKQKLANGAELPEIIEEIYRYLS